MQLAWQGSLLGSAEPTIDATFRELRRVELGEDSWIDVVPGWLTGADQVFGSLADRAPWSQRDRVMWGNKVKEPRLTCGWAEANVKQIAPVLLDARLALTAHYGVAFNSGWLNLYRDGEDSVAWHRDRIPLGNPYPWVAILSLGSQRKFLVRPYGGGPSLRFDPAPGDLLVTGGFMQRHFEHTVPKVKDAGPRISVTFRHIHDGDETKMGGVDEKVKVGLVGAGPWANMVHAPILANHPETELVGVWARRPEAAEKVAGRNGTVAVASYEELLDTCEAVAFCVPPDVQAEMALAAAQAGKTLLLEKPIALELDAAQRLVDAVDTAGVRTVLLLSLRYADSVKVFLEEAKTIGAPLGGRVAWVSGALREGSPFATPWRLERGPLPDLGPHAVDLIDAALGPVTAVKASGDRLGWVSLLLTHESGATSTVDLCATAGASSVSSVEVFGTEGAAALDASAAADANSMMNVPAALAAAHRGERSDAPDVHRGLHLQRILEDAGRQLR